jgi:hypothetical protein
MVFISVTRLRLRSMPPPATGNTLSHQPPVGKLQPSILPETVACLRSNISLQTSRQARLVWGS